MTTKKKIILTVLLGVMVAIGVYCVVTETITIINEIQHLNEFPDKIQYYLKFFIRWIIYLIFFIVSIIVDVFIIKKFWGKEIAYSYQDYKQEKEKRYVKRLEKQKTIIEQRKAKIEDKIKHIKN